jgi:hypothetical protein
MNTAVSSGYNSSETGALQAETSFLPQSDPIMFVDMVFTEEETRPVDPNSELMCGNEDGVAQEQDDNNDDNNDENNDDDGAAQEQDDNNDENNDDDGAAQERESSDNTLPPGLSSDQSFRQQELMRELSRYGLHLRLDSQLCRRYIMDGPKARVNDVRHVVQKMCTAQYLHMYCNHALGHAIAVNTKKMHVNLHGTRYSAECFLELLQRCILLTTRYNKLPMVWPWMAGISPRNWATFHDISQLIIANPTMPREELLRL